ncbi:MAG: ORF6N domain-containing protein [Candidatus Saganbacteria bacterium]|nr:ORF6N domain-containing protein [Candidatus Saganbacteria bacterium]
MNELIPVERIEQRIYLIRGQKVMLDRDLAELYGVETFVLNQAVKRNLGRFPEDFMFSLDRQEIMRISQIVISSSIKYAKHVNAFTESGVAMLSSVLRSERAIRVNIAIMRAFTRLRHILSSHKELARKIEALEKKHDKHEIEIATVFKVLKKLMEPPPDKPAKRIGFRTGDG